MRPDLTDVTIVLDRSGSMDSCREEAENGVNHFIKEQKEQPGDCTLSLIQFDTEYEVVHSGVPIAEVPEFTLVPRGMTALLDAVGRAINETGERLAAVGEEDCPGLVIFVILTDGLENASSEFTKPGIKEMIERQQTQYQWQFTFLGANQDAFAEARGLGIGASGTMNFDTECTTSAMGGMSQNVSDMRMSASKGQAASFGYTPGQRQGAMGR